MRRLSGKAEAEEHETIGNARAHFPRLLQPRFSCVVFDVTIALAVRVSCLSTSVYEQLQVTIRNYGRPLRAIF